MSIKCTAIKLLDAILSNVEHIDSRPVVPMQYIADEIEELQQEVAHEDK